MAARYLREPVFIQVTHREEAPPDIEQTVVEVWSGDKFPVLVALLDQPAEGATIVFGRTRRGVENLARRLGRLGFEIAALQGDLGQAARDKIMARFRAGHVPILLATNVAARGLDMLNIDRVINYDLPDTVELFTHRVGRTGRMGRSGQAISLVTATDLQMLQQIERALAKKLPRVTAPPTSEIVASTPRLMQYQGSVTRPQAPAAVAAPIAPVTEAVSQETGPPRRRRRPRRPATAVAVAG
jgi:superfamily II DNA/RNA helicase